MRGKSQKIVFIGTVIIYIITMVALNCTLRRDEVGALMNLSTKLSDNALTGAILIGSLITVFILTVVLILSRFLLQLVFKVIYKNSNDKLLLNESYFVPLTIKIFLLIILQFVMVSGFTVKSVWISLISIALYCGYIFIFKNANIAHKNAKDKLFQVVTGILLILAL